MPEKFSESESNEGPWSQAPESLKHDEFMQSYFQTSNNTVPPVPANQDEQQYEPRMYQQQPAEHFEMEYPFPNQGYFVPTETDFAQSYPQPVYKVTKSRGGLRHMPSRGHLYISPHNAFIPPTVTPPGSGGIPGPLVSTGAIPHDAQQWQEVRPERASSSSPPPQVMKPRASRSRLARDTQSGPVARAKFSLEEDSKILKLRFTDGLGWSVIASKYMPHRSEKGLQVHYSVSLKDQVESYNREWTPEEDQELIRLVGEHQRAMWTVISKRFGNGSVAPTACFVRHRLLMRRDEDELEASVQAFKAANRS